MTDPEELELTPTLRTAILRLADELGSSPQSLLQSALHSGLADYRLNGSRRAVPRPSIRVPAANRTAVEQSAIVYRAAAALGGPPPNPSDDRWDRVTPKDLRKAEGIAWARFSDPSVGDFLSPFARYPDWEELFEKYPWTEQIALGPAPLVPIKDIRRAMKLDAASLLTTLHVPFCIGLPEDLELDGFSDAIAVTLVSGLSHPSELATLRAIRIEVALDLDPSHGRRAPDRLHQVFLYTDDGETAEDGRRKTTGTYTCHERDRARVLLEHVVSVLRSAGIRAACPAGRVPDHPAFSTQIRERFRDGTMHLYGVHDPGPWYATVGITQGEQFSDFAPPRDLLKAAWDEARDQLGVHAESAMMLQIEDFRRSLLVIESEYSAVPQGEGKGRSLGRALREPAFGNILNALYNDTPELFDGMTPSEVKEQLPQLRHKTSHLQRYATTLDGSAALTEPFGTELYNTDFRTALRRVGRVAAAVRAIIIRGRVRGLPTITPKRGSENLARIFEFIQKSSPEAVAKHHLVHLALQRIAAGNDHPDAAALIRERIDARTREEANLLVDCCEGNDDWTGWLLDALTVWDLLTKVTVRRFGVQQGLRDELLRRVAAAMPDRTKEAAALIESAKSEVGR